MKRLAVITAILSIALTVSNASASTFTGLGNPIDAAALAGGTVIDFDGGPTGDYSSLTLLGVTFNDLDYTFRISSAYIGSYNTEGTYSLQNGDYDSTMTHRLRFDFASAVDAFGFNWGASDDTWLLSAFDSSNNLLDSLSIAPTQSSNSGDYFGIASSNISYATIVNQSGDAGDLIFLDDFTYKGQGGGGNGVIPEPTTMSLLGLGLLGLAKLRRKR